MGLCRRWGAGLAIALAAVAPPAHAAWALEMAGPRAIADAVLVETADFSFRIPRAWRRLADAERPVGAALALGVASATEAATFAVYRRANRPRYVHEESRLWVLERPHPSDSFDVQVLDGAIGFARSDERLPTGGRRFRSSFQRGATGYDLVITRTKAPAELPDGTMMAASTWRWSEAAMGVEDDGDRCRAWAGERDRNLDDARDLFQLLMAPPLCAYPDEPSIREPYMDALTGTEHYLTRHYAQKLTAHGCPP